MPGYTRAGRRHQEEISDPLPGPPLASAAPAEKADMPNNQPVAPTLPPMTGPIFPTPQKTMQFNNGAYNPTTAPFGMDMSGPGVQEQFWNNNQGLWFNTPQLDWVNSMLPQFQNPWFGEQTNQRLAGNLGNPGAGQQYWNSIRGGFNTMNGAEQSIMGGYQGPNNAQAAFGQTQAALPGSFNPQFDAYYDRMAQKAMSNVNTQAAARGVYGSSSALNGAIGAGLDIEAQRAKAATDFMFADSANQRQWMDLLGSQARTADLSGLDIFDRNRLAAQYGLDKMKLGGDLAFSAEEAENERNRLLSDIAFGVDDRRNKRLTTGADLAGELDAAYRQRLNDAFGAAGLAQGKREGRITGLEDSVTDFTNDIGNFFMENYDQLLGADGQLNEEALNTLLAQTADQRGWSDQQREVIFRDVKAAWDTVFGKKADATNKGTEH